MMPLVEMPPRWGESITCPLRKDIFIIPLSISQDGSLTPSGVTYLVKDRNQMVCRSTVKEREDTHLCVASMHKTIKPSLEELSLTFRNLAHQTRTPKATPLKKPFSLMTPFDRSDFQVDFMWNPVTSGRYLAPLRNQTT